MYPVIHIPFFGILTFHFPAYALFAFAGLLFLMLFLYFRVKQISMDFRMFLLMILCMAVGVGIGSKALFVVTKLPEILNDFSPARALYIVITSGFVFYGGLLGAILGLYLFGRCQHLSFHTLSQIVAPGFPLFHFWGRLGCFFAGCCYGKEAAWGIPMEKEPDIPRIPIQLFEACCVLLIFLLLLWLERVFKGEAPLLNVYLLLYALCRFILEFFRGDTVRGIWRGLSTSQWISLFIVLILFAEKRIFRKRKRRGNYAEVLS